MCLSNTSGVLQVGSEDEELVSCETDVESDHLWYVRLRKLNQTLPVPSYIVTKQGRKSEIKISRR